MTLASGARSWKLLFEQVCRVKDGREGSYPLIRRVLVQPCDRLQSHTPGVCGSLRWKTRGLLTVTRQP